MKLKKLAKTLTICLGLSAIGVVNISSAFASDNLQAPKSAFDKNWFYNKCWGLRKFSGSNIYFFAKK